VAFASFKDTRDRIDKTIATLSSRYGDQPSVSEPIKRLVQTWTPLRVSADRVLASREAVSRVSAAADRSIADLSDRLSVLATIGSVSPFIGLFGTVWGIYHALTAIGLSGQMHGMVALDDQNQVVREAILWNDQRTERQCQEITAAAGGLDGLLGMTNNQMLTGYTGGKSSGSNRMSRIIMPGPEWSSTPRTTSATA